jgi:glycosyltransferase involved in cell wall biosynthesis
LKDKVLNIHYFVELSSATLHARALPLARSLKKHRIHCKIVLPIKWSSIAGGKLCEILSIFLTHNPKDYIRTLQIRPAAVIIGRSSSINLFLFQTLLRLRGIKVIFDLDDAVVLPSISFLGAKVRSPAYFCAEKMLQHSDSVIVNGNYLLSYSKRFNNKVTVIHVPVDTELFHPRKKLFSSKITIGWQGNPANHYDNLAMLIKPLETLAKEHNIRFKMASSMGDAKVKQMFEHLENLVEIDYGSDHWLYLRQFAEQLFDFDIMVAPLATNNWNQGKSALRVSAGMAMGIPVVASPVGEQKYVVHHGVNGFLAANEIEWYSFLKVLVEKDELRFEMGRHARETSENELSLDISGKRLNLIIRSLQECS